MKKGEKLEFNYEGKYREVTLAPGRYTFELWGARGYGYNYNSSCTGGLGGYTSCTVTVDTETKFYLCVGGKGTNNGGGFNGGGSSGTNGYSGGGGATHIATALGNQGYTAPPGPIWSNYPASAAQPYCWFQENQGCTYSNYYAYSGDPNYCRYHGCSGWARRPQYDFGAQKGTLAALVDNKAAVIAVAGAGGGSAHYIGPGGNGGGAAGGDGNNGGYSANGKGASQTAGGASGGGSAVHGNFGYGGNGYRHGGGGGAGYYGGGGGDDCYGTGGGGSGYVNTSLIDSGFTVRSGDSKYVSSSNADGKLVITCLDPYLTEIYFKYGGKWNLIL